MGSLIRLFLFAGCCLSLAIVVTHRGSLVAVAQDSKVPTEEVSQKNSLPLEWLGTWSGTVQSRSASGKEQTFRMKLTIAPTDRPGTLTWTIVYDGDQGRSTREYQLVQKNVARGEFVIDEKNGILLDATLLGNSLSSHFTIQGQRIWSSYRLVDSDKRKEIQFELFSADERASTKSGGEGAEVISLKTASRQFAVLMLQNPEKN